MTVIVPAVDLEGLVYGADLRCQTRMPPLGDRCPEPATWLLLLPCGCSVMYGDQCQLIVDAWLAALTAAGIGDVTCAQCRQLTSVAAAIWEPI